MDEKFVDLGLSVKWADRNIGALDADEFGDYFDYDEAMRIGKLPTVEQCEELIKECEFKFDKKRKGFIVRGKNGNEIFFPCSGEKNGVIEKKTVGAFFWTREVNVIDQKFAYHMGISKKTYGKNIKTSVYMLERGKYYISIRMVK